jgi:polyisoprenoid-binding protein YceI
MFKHCILSLFVLLQMGSVSAQQPDSQTIFATKSGIVTFRSDAPLELITASSSELRGAIDVNTRNFTFSVTNRSLKGFNSPLQQEHFYENYIEAGSFPVSTFKGKIIEQTDLTLPGNYQVRAKGILDIHGVTQERIIKVNLQVKNGQIVITSEFLVPLSDHNITIPRIVYQKIAEEIVVTVEAVLTGGIKK